MGNRFASGKHAISVCDRCGFKFKLKELRKEVVKTKIQNILVCPQCWTKDHPQLQLGMYPVSDPQGLREPRTDTTYKQAGPTAAGFPSEGSRVIQWGWNPVGGAMANDDGLTPNDLVVRVLIGTVTVVAT